MSPNENGKEKKHIIDLTPELLDQLLLNNQHQITESIKEAGKTDHRRKRDVIRDVSFKMYDGAKKILFLHPNRKQVNKTEYSTKDDFALPSSSRKANNTSFVMSRLRDPTSFFFHYKQHPQHDISKVTVQLLCIASLKPHEQIVSPERLFGLKRATLHWDAFTQPLLVDLQTGAILDGHHRYHVGLLLQCLRLPVVFVDYLNDPNITVDVWPDCGRHSITKQQVIRMALDANQLFPAKTSRHAFADNLPPISIPLSVLKQPASSQETLAAHQNKSQLTRKPRLPSISLSDLLLNGNSSQAETSSKLVRRLFRNRVHEFEDSASPRTPHNINGAGGANGKHSQLDVVSRPNLLDPNWSSFFNAIRVNDPTSSFCQQRSFTFEDILGSEKEKEKPFLLTRITDPTSYFYKYRFENVRPRQPKRVTVHLVAVSWLKAHEEVVSWDRVEGLAKATLEWEAYLEPLLVDLKTGSILDGHHRYHVGKKLNLFAVPAVLVDYLNDDSIKVDVWPNCGLDTLSKDDVIQMSLSKDVYPPKTSRHEFSDDLPPISVPLARLRQINKTHIAAI